MYIPNVAALLAATKAAKNHSCFFSIYIFIFFRVFFQKVTLDARAWARAQLHADAALARRDTAKASELGLEERTAMVEGMMADVEAYELELRARGARRLGDDLLPVSYTHA